MMSMVSQKNVSIGGYKGALRAKKLCLICCSRKYPYSLPSPPSPPPCYRRIGAEGIRFSLAMVGGGRGVCKTKKFEETYEAQLEYFHRGGGGGRRYWIFSSTTQQEIIKLK